MDEVIKGDVLTKDEMKQRGITVKQGTRGGAELHAPTYEKTPAAILIVRGIIEPRHIEAACDYL